MDSKTLSFGDWLRFQIDRRGWQEADFAREAGVSTGVASNWINDRRRPLSASCYTIASALRLDPRVVLWKAGHLKSEDVPLDLEDILVSYSAMNQHRLTWEQKLSLVDIAEQLARGNDKQQ